jgi:hypothetical protein
MLEVHWFSNGVIESKPFSGTLEEAVDFLKRLSQAAPVFLGQVTVNGVVKVNAGPGGVIRIMEETH